MLKNIVFFILIAMPCYTCAMIHGKIHEEIPIFLHIKSIKSNIDDYTAFNLASTIVEASKFHNMDPNLITSVIQNESMFRQNAVSRMGAIGYMQVIEKWHRPIIKKYFKKFQSNSLFNLKVNIWTGTEILANYIEKHKTIKRGLQAYHGSQNNYYYRKIMRSLPKFTDVVIFVPNQNLYISEKYIFINDNSKLKVYSI